MKVEYNNLGQIIASLHGALKWWKKIDIQTGGTRLDEIQKYLDELLNPTTPEANSFSRDPLGVDAYSVLNDAAGFGRIAKGLSSVSTNLLPRGALRDVLRGSLAASKESEDVTTDPRNKFVELELAANCSAAGFNIIGFDDLKFEFEGQKYFVECKRPSCSKTLDQNIDKAYIQLKARIGDSSARGLVAVAVEKVFDLDQTFHEVDSHADTSRLGLSIGKEFVARVSKFRNLWLDTRVVGVVGIIRFLAKVRRPECISYSYQVCIAKLASEHEGQQAESERLDRMAVALRS